MDYINSDNEGHIFCKLVNRSNEDKVMLVKKGEGFMQGIFLPFGITEDDNATAKRNGGFGSTTKSKYEQATIDGNWVESDLN